MKLIYFNRPDCPENMGISQMTDNIELFIEERKYILKDAIIESDKLTFVKGYEKIENEIVETISDENLEPKEITRIEETLQPIYGYALIFDVPNDFNN